MVVAWFSLQCQAFGLPTAALPVGTRNLQPHKCSKRIVFIQFTLESAKNGLDRRQTSPRDEAGVGKRTGIFVCNGRRPEYRSGGRNWRLFALWEHGKARQPNGNPDKFPKAPQQGKGDSGHISISESRQQQEIAGVLCA